MIEAPMPRADEPMRPQRWGLGDVVLGFTIGLVASWLVLAVILEATGRAADEVDALPLSLVLLAQAGLWAGLLGAPLLATARRGNGPVRDLRVRVERTDLWRGGLIGVLLQLVALPLLYWPLLELINKKASDLEGPAQSLADRADGTIGVLLLVLIAGIGAPIIEEIFYRGLFQRALLKRGASPAVAIGVNATVFGVSHFQLLQLPALVLFGVVAGVLAHRSGRLGPAITAHIAFNMVTVVSLLLR